ncbi:UNVERIFIED_CONTAM: hypothetical protein K2H54_000517 [Gekko kuhli]
MTQNLVAQQVALFTLDHRRWRTGRSAQLQQMLPTLSSQTATSGGEKLENSLETQLSTSSCSGDNELGLEDAGSILHPRKHPQSPWSGGDRKPSKDLAAGHLTGWLAA